MPAAPLHSDRDTMTSSAQGCADAPYQPIAELHHERSMRNASAAASRARGSPARTDHAASVTPIPEAPSARPTTDLDSREGSGALGFEDSVHRDINSMSLSADRDVAVRNSGSPERSASPSNPARVPALPCHRPGESALSVSALAAWAACKPICIPL